MDAQGNVFECQVILDWRKLNEDALSLRNFKWVDILMLGLDLIFSASYMDDLFDVQTFD